MIIPTRSSTLLFTFFGSDSMNHALNSSYVASRTGTLSLFVAASFFHSSPVMERKRKSSWSYRSNSINSKIRMESKRSLLREVSEYAEYLFQSWKDDDNPVWFRKPYWSKGARLNGFSMHESQSGSCKFKRGFDFSISDDDDVENIIHCAFRGERYYYWNSSRDGKFHWRCSSGHYHKASSGWSDEADVETDDDTFADNCSQPNLTSERLTLGLSASGPLKLAEIKSAYRVCALRWHPDRHQGTSKALAEEKFKHCSTAYKSLCDNLTAS